MDFRFAAEQQAGGHSFRPKYWSKSVEMETYGDDRTNWRCRDYLNRCCNFRCSLNPKYCHLTDFLVLYLFFFWGWGRGKVSTVNVHVYGHIYIQYHVYSICSASFTALTGAEWLSKKNCWKWADCTPNHYFVLTFYKNSFYFHVNKIKKRC